MNIFQRSLAGSGRFALSFRNGGGVEYNPARFGFTQEEMRHLAERG